MKKKFEIGLLLVLLVFSVMPLYGPVVVDSGVIDSPRNPSLSDRVYTNIESGFDLWWTSRWQSIPLRIQNYSIVTGDHVVLNVTTDIPDVFEISLLVNDSLGSCHAVFANSSGSQLLYDTYSFGTGQNMTANITVWVHTLTSGTYSQIYHSVSINNFFAPILTLHPPFEIVPPPDYQIAQIPRPVSDRTWEFSWECMDFNANDTNYFSVWLSDDGGATFLLLQPNLTVPYYSWDSTGFWDTEYIYRVRAYSLDFTVLDDLNNSLCSVDYPPNSYWPGDYVDGQSMEFGGSDGPIQYYRASNVAVNHPIDLTFFLSQPSKQVVWELHSDGSGDQTASIIYTILRNGTTHITDTETIAPSATRNVTLKLDELDEGIYEFTIEFLNPGYLGDYVEDSIIVTILAESSVLIVAAGISGGLLVGIVILEVFRRVYVKRKSADAPEQEAPDFSILLFLKQ
ncbi:MAG: hypothetical protein ACFFDM_06515 [Candidatus Thorarchaeota archaeon]